MGIRSLGSVLDQLFEFDVGGTVYALTTNGTGCANQSLNLAAIGGQSATYQIRPMFEGAGFKTKNLTIPDPYGHDYPVCTTLQWDFKSSQNSATLTVEAPKTDATVSEPASPEDEVTVTQTTETTTVTIPPAKTPEQIQQDAGVQVWGPDSWNIFPPAKTSPTWIAGGAIIATGIAVAATLLWKQRKRT